MCLVRMAYSNLCQCNLILKRFAQITRYNKCYYCGEYSIKNDRYLKERKKNTSKLIQTKLYSEQYYCFVNINNKILNTDKYLR